MIVNVLFCLYLLGVPITFIWLWIDVSPVEEARGETSDVARGATFVGLLFVYVIMAVFWPLLVFIGGPILLIGKVIGMMLR